ncbi:hypothetical protein A8950_3137 [Dongia mobilis]|uniref:DUF1109 family protein n=1 Tax=Dongia mobilis TaxID=578943 RepID=A0A4R6WJM5_9PROT|nr:DUF1109 domain-containing protein [Dongia mobilis]TDQ80602.1 hypothetical protein A8950_3137 [Dongia mobilis]
MKTDQLIDSLVADQGRRVNGSGMTLLASLPIALLVSIALFAYVLDMRDDLAAALESWRYLLKLLLPALVAVAAIALMLHLARPQAAAAVLRWLAWLAVPLVLGLLAEAVLVPRESWGVVAIGQNPLFCLFFVPALSLPPLAAALWSLSRGAPQSPTAAGIVAGLAAGGIGALLYAAHCDNDSPFYLALWYLGGISIVTLLGGLIGHRYLRW